MAAESRIMASPPEQGDASVLPAGTAIYAFTFRGLELAARIAEKTGALVHAPESLSDLPAGLEKKDIRFFSSLTDVMRTNFSAHPCHIFISAAGIAVRAIAPHIGSKMRDPAVLVLDQQARHVVSLLSGHSGGANDLAGRIAGLTGAVPVISTATDLEGLPAVDVLAKEQGLAIANPGLIKKVSAAMLRGERPLLLDPAALLLPAGDSRRKSFESLAPVAGKHEYPRLLASLAGLSRLCVVVTEYNLPEHLEERCLLLHPRSLFVGIGCKRGSAGQNIIGFVRQEFAACRLSLHSLAGLASVDIKKDEAGLHEAAARLEIPIFFFSPAELSAYPSPTPSPKAREVLGLPGVAEPASLAAAERASGRTAELLVTKRTGKGLTLAMARASGGPS